MKLQLLILSLLIILVTGCSDGEEGLKEQTVIQTKEEINAQNQNLEAWATKLTGGLNQRRAFINGVEDEFEGEFLVKESTNMIRLMIIPTIPDYDADRTRTLAELEYELQNLNIKIMQWNPAIGGTLEVMEMIEISDNLYTSKILLKFYSDSLNNGNDLLEKLMPKSSSKKKMRKYLINSEGLALICSNFFLDNEVLGTMRDQCQLDFFDICPIFFSKYEQNKSKMIKNLNDILGEGFNETDCQDYINEELENE